MADPQGPQELPQGSRKTSPTPSPPALDTADSELRQSRKREREVSVEPIPTPSSTAEIDATSHDRKDSRTPAKKNRRYLSTTIEEDDGGTRSRSNSVSPPLGVSPPQEMKIKVRQISQGVEDLSWRNMQPFEQKDEEMAGDEAVKDSTDSASFSSNQATAADQDVVIGELAADTTEPSPPRSPSDSQAHSTIPEIAQTQEDIAITTSTAEGESDAGRVTHAGALEPEQSLLSSSRLRSDSENGEKGLKRKFLERGTSQGPVEAPETSNENHTGEALKRQRDDADRDDNPRETKRPSPPPEKSTEKTSPPSPKVPKLGGFMAYASTSSPFASVKGKNIFSSKNTSTSSFPSTTSSSPVPGFGPPLGESSSKGSTEAPSGSTSSGFAAFASSTSPFVTASRAKSPAYQAPFNQTPVPSSPPKRSGFEAFSSSVSPFASVARAKSPVLGSASRLGRTKSPGPRRNNSFTSNPFATYAAGGAQGFAAPAPKRARAGSPEGSSSRGSLERNLTAGSDVFGQSNNDEDEGSADEDEEEQPTTFGERLRAGRDDDDHIGGDDQNRVMLEEQEVVTGEEDEETIMQVRGKLFALKSGTQWKERGTGILKLNVRREDGGNPRLVMRKDAVFSLLLNVTLFPGMKCSLAQDPRYMRFSVIEGGNLTHYNLRVANAKIAQEFLEEVNASIPTA